jgi:hypothetical protein
MNLGSLALVVTTVSWVGIIVLLRRTARFQIHAQRRLAELQNRDEAVTAYLKVLKDEHHAAQQVIASWSPADQTANNAALHTALTDLSTAVAEVDAEEIRHLPEQPP